MISFEMLPAAARAFFALWALLLCLVNIGSTVLAAAGKRYSFSALALLIFAPSYLLWQVIFDFSLLGGTGKTAKATAPLCALPTIYWALALAALSVAAVLLFGFNIRYNRNNITPDTIKLYLDKMPCGVCCWRKNGRVLFSNICMNRLCLAITGQPLLNGNQFHVAVKDGIINADGGVWRFATRGLTVDGERLYEMIASDITAEYAKTEALERDKAELSRLNQELRDYYLSIDETVAQQEILQAKMNIHDEMNRLMLSTVAADKENTKELDNIFSLWEQNALLLCMEAENRESQTQAGAAEALARALGVSLLWQGELPSFSDKQSELFFFALQEAIINAVKHAQAKALEISFEKEENSLVCRFTNDGELPSEEVRFNGGLANLSRLAEKQSAALGTEIDNNFTLTLKYHPFG